MSVQPVGQQRPGAHGLRATAHREKLVVHPWTFWRENSFLPDQFRQGNPASPTYLAATGDLPGWIARFYELGVDGLFSDNADTAVATRAEVFEKEPGGARRGRGANRRRAHAARG